MRALPVTTLLIFALAATALGRGREPGSILVYPVHRSGPDFFTMVAITNSNLAPQSPFDFGGSVSLHYLYANVTPNPSDPFMPLGCTVFNRFELLTPGDTLCVATSCHNATAPQGNEGFLVVSAQSPTAFDQDDDFNYVMGSEAVLNASGGMYAMNAIPFDALDRKAASAGLLALDGVAYEAGPDRLYVDNFVAVAGSQLAIANFTGGPTATNTLQFTVWNDNEIALSTTRTFRCWFDQPLVNVSPLFSESFLRSTQHDPDELDVQCNGNASFETGWARIDSVGVASSGGFPIASDGLVLGSISAGPASFIDGGHLLWESKTKQTNGSARLQ